MPNNPLIHIAKKKNPITSRSLYYIVYYKNVLVG